ncbi:hypothetical protein PBI_KAMPE_28 [Gordonia phage Kampe]|uniref:Uncharacterized protein n=3 Tax=Gordonia phage Orchid TaxID=1838075 RepID=A0A160DHB0_9CAUD|nr:hypothetical protein BH761_gp028 [Gordonia phage Orchid]ANA87262.1 hypothetical protein PBI_PATRICKSTAR_28 [Gordonia phage PatrickStar]ANA87375.1 hypothetical protein PBI_ORCHID_28 [Gordonia phage Orchid]ANA87489.1 hypothetical protein PBI_KAMPE_28 [Gordonia phage Kampe]
MIVNFNGIELDIEIDENEMLCIKRDGLAKGAVSVRMEEPETPEPEIEPIRQEFVPDNPILPDGFNIVGDDVLDEQGNSVFGKS